MAAQGRAHGVLIPPSQARPGPGIDTAAATTQPGYSPSELTYLVFANGIYITRNAASTEISKFQKRRILFPNNLFVIK
ncbi:hypothetical protein BGLA2_1270023 [Burkholderia gladioli]|nr:hypothetical protein BGLA2_1270023 [Burkholderia gladioli]